MKRGTMRWILPLLRYGLCAAAIGYLVLHVPWYDYVHLNDPSRTRVRLLEERGNTLLVERDDQRMEIGLEQVHRVAGGAILDIEYGISTVVRRLDFGKALWGVLIFLPVPFLQSLRLVWMLAIQEVRLSFWNSVKLAFAGNFFNFALPGTTGGDLIKAYYLTRFTHLKTEAVTTVFLDRAIGLLGLVLLAGVMILIVWDPERFGVYLLVLGLICGSLAVGAVLVFSHRARHWLGLPSLAQRLPLGEHLLRIGRATVAMRRHKTLVMLSLLNTVALQMVVMLSAFVMARALDMRGSVTHYLIYVPIGFLIAAVPISPPQAFGVMEWAYVQFFAYSGLSTVSQAVAFALAVRVIQLVWALPGVLVPLLGAHLPSQADLEALNLAAAEPVDGPTERASAAAAGASRISSPK